MTNSTPFTIPCTRGDTLIFSAPVTNPDNSVYDLSGCVIWFTVKDSALPTTTADADADITAYWTPISSDGITVEDPTTGIIEVLIPADRTVGLSQTTTYRYDIQVKDIDGNVTSVAKGPLTVSDDVTLRTTAP